MLFYQQKEHNTRLLLCLGLATSFALHGFAMVCIRLLIILKKDTALLQLNKRKNQAAQVSVCITSAKNALPPDNYSINSLSTSKAITQNQKTTKKQQLAKNKQTHGNISSNTNIVKSIPKNRETSAINHKNNKSMATTQEKKAIPAQVKKIIKQKPIQESIKVKTIAKKQVKNTSIKQHAETAIKSIKKTQNLEKQKQEITQIPTQIEQKTDIIKSSNKTLNKTSDNDKQSLKTFTQKKIEGKKTVTPVNPSTPIHQETSLPTTIIPSLLATQTLLETQEIAPAQASVNSLEQGEYQMSLEKQELNLTELEEDAIDTILRQEISMHYKPPKGFEEYRPASLSFEISRYGKPYNFSPPHATPLALYTAMKRAVLKTNFHRKYWNIQLTLNFK